MKLDDVIDYRFSSPHTQRRERSKYGRLQKKITNDLTYDQKAREVCERRLRDHRKKYGKEDDELTPHSSDSDMSGEATELEVSDWRGRGRSGSRYRSAILLVGSLPQGEQKLHDAGNISDRFGPVSGS